MYLIESRGLKRLEILESCWELQALGKTGNLMYPKLLLDENVPDETAFHWTFDWKMSCLREPKKSSLDATNLFLSPRSFIIY